MSRNRGRPARQYRLRIRTLRRDLIDYEALARAALEQAAMDQQSDVNVSSADQLQSRREPIRNGKKEPRHDRLA